jgi:uncharacterized protein
MRPLQDMDVVRLVVLQPTPYCNIACDYCYLPRRDKRSVMHPEVLDAIGARLLAHPLTALDATVVWHAGEPLVLPAAWYAQAIDRLHMAAGRVFSHAIQTNGIGLDETWVRLARAKRLRLGLSLDGPADLHDARRRTRSGRATHPLVMGAVRVLQDAGLDFHVITVLTRAHLSEPERLYAFYRAEGLRRVGFNIEEVEGDNRASSLAGADDLFREFFRRFLACMEAEPGALLLREAIEAEGALLHARPGLLSDQADPLRIVSVDVEGNVASFSPELLGAPAGEYGSFSFGNLCEEGIAPIAQRIRASRLAADIAAGVEACRRSCAFFAFCGGGAPANKWFEHGSFAGSETLFCRLARKVVLEEVLLLLERRVAAMEGRRAAVALHE